MDHDKRLYTQFMYRACDIRTHGQLETMIADAGISHNVLIADLSSMSSRERTAEINSSIASERARFYYPGDPEYILSVYRLEEEKYLLILSVCGSFMEEQPETLRRMCLRLFGCRPEECSSLIRSTAASDRSSVSYWSGLFDSLDIDKFKGVHRSGSRLNMVSFRADDAVEEAFDRFTERGGSGSALCATVLGQMASHLLESPQVIVSQILTGTPLSSAPVILSNASGYGSSLREVIAQFKKVSTSCFCSREELYHAVGNRFINRIMISSGYADPNMYTSLINRMEPGICYKQPAIDTLNSPLSVFTSRFDGRMELTYFYDEDAFSSVDMLKLHEAVCGLFRKALNLDDDTVGAITKENFIIKAKPSENTPESPADKVRFSTARKLHIFKKYDDAELAALLKDISFIVRNPRQYILAPGEKADRLYIICSGQVSVMGRNAEGFVNPLFISGPGDVFGAESLTQDPVLKNIYRAYTEDVILISIDRDTVLAESRKHPEILQYVLGRQIDISVRFQKLWLTV